MYWIQDKKQPLCRRNAIVALLALYHVEDVPKRVPEVQRIPAIDHDLAAGPFRSFRARERLFTRKEGVGG